MLTKNSLATAAATVAAFSSCATAFDASANTNMAVYWGQGDSQQRLAHYCEDSSIDIIPIGFLNVFPDQTGGYPGTNFANQCGDATYTNLDGTKSPLLSDCPLIGADIVTCQTAGKKILLSLGGANPSNQEIKDDASAVEFATFLWNAFGPKDPAYTGPRPFGDAAVDGFDFDIESSLSKVSGPSGLSCGYATMIRTLRSFYALEKKAYYISSAPQCLVPDVHLADAIQKSYFDFIFVQFYNTPQCSARAFFDHTYGSYGGPATDISFDAWASFVRSNSKNPKAKIYLGLPASPAETYDAKMYIQPNEVPLLISKFQCDYADNFGGLMLFEATSAELNTIDNKSYTDILKTELLRSNCAQKPTTTSALPSSTSSSSGTALSVSTSSSHPSTSIPTTSSSTSSSVTAPASNSSSQSSTSASTTSSSTGSSVSSLISTTSSSSNLTSTSTSSTSSSTRSTNSTTKVGPTVPLGPTGSAPITRSSTTATNSTTFRTKSIGTGASVPVSASPTGASGSSSLSLGHTFNAPYPVSNNSTSTPTSTGGTAGIVYTTETIVITSCAPEVKSCPARTSITVRPISTSIPGSGKATSAGNSGTPTSSATSVSKIGPAKESSSTPGLVITEIVYTTLTTCPVTQTVTSSGRPITQTSSTVSTIYSTSTSTICTKCIATPTSSLAPTWTPASSTASVLASKSSSLSTLISTAAPVKSLPATSQAVVTTEIVYTTVTTCPVTKTMTSSGSVIVQTTQTVSTVTSTSVSTICTQCIAPNTNVPVSASSGASVPPQSPSSTPSRASPGVSSSAPSDTPSGAAPQSSSPSGNSPVQASNSVTAQILKGTSTRSITSTVIIPASSQAQSSIPPTSNGPSPSTASVITMTLSPIPLSPSQTEKAQSSASTSSGTAPVVPVSSVSPASATSAESSPSVASISTMIVIPVPMNPSQTAQPTKSTPSVQPINAAPFPSGNATSPLGASAKVSASSVVVPSASNFKTVPANPAQFTGAASKMHVGVTAVVMILAAAAFPL